MKIAIAGTGYVGLVTGVCFAEHGHQVTCIDALEEKIRLLQAGVSPIYEPGIEELLAKNRERLTFTTDPACAYRGKDIIFIGVGTPEKKDGSANLSYVFEVAEQIAEQLDRDCVIAVKSTVPIGTNDKVEARIRAQRPQGLRVSIVSNPEFLAQGTAVRDTLHPARIVVGAEDEAAAQIMRQAYAGFDAPLIVTDRKSAEMIKYASNDFLALKLSYINEIANICELIGADVEDVSQGMGYDPRIGNQFLKAGIGYGGSCFPKDTKALHWLANFHDYEIKTVKAAIEVNGNQKIKPVKIARRYFDSFEGVTVACLGLTFKPGTDDLREAPSLVNIPLLLDDGAYIRAWDPVGRKNFEAQCPSDQITYCADIESALTGADLCMIFTEWDAVKALDVKLFAQRMKTPIIIDGRNCYPVAALEAQPVNYHSIGRRPVLNMGYIPSAR